MDLLDVVGEAVIQIIHVTALLFARFFDGVDAGRRHHGVLSLGERDIASAAAAGALVRAGRGLAGAARRRAESIAAGARDDQAVRWNSVRHIVRLGSGRTLVGRIHAG